MNTFASYVQIYMSTCLFFLSAQGLNNSFTEYSLRMFYPFLSLITKYIWAERCSKEKSNLHTNKPIN